MKKLCFTLVAAALAFSIMLTGCGSKAKVSLGTGKGSAGDYAEVTINMDNNPGIWGGQIIIDYDYVNFSFESISNGTVFETCESNDTGKSVILVVTHTISSDAKLEDSKNNGTIATLKFKIKTGASEGKHDITINSESNFCNAKEEMLELELGNGSIKVK